MKLLKAKEQNNILKAAREKQLIVDKEFSVRLQVYFSLETMEAWRKEWDDTLKVLKEKTVNQQFYIEQKNPLKMKEKLRYFQINKS